MPTRTIATPPQKSGIRVHGASSGRRRWSRRQPWRKNATATAASDERERVERPRAPELVAWRRSQGRHARHCRRTARPGVRLEVGHRMNARPGVRLEVGHRREARYRSTCSEPPQVAEHEVALAIGDVVERHRAERLDERDASGGEELVLVPAVDDADVARAELARLVARSSSSPSRRGSASPARCARGCGARPSFPART